MLKGTLDDFTLPDIFRLTSQSNKTGRLEVQRSAGHGNVYFRQGDVYFAESTLSRELIGQKLVKMKVLTDGQLIKALDEQAESGGRLGEVLRSSGLVSDEQLEAALRSQIEDAVFDLLRWDSGEFDWAPDEETEAEVSLSVSVENLIMEGSRRLDELSIITRKIPSENAIVAMAPAPPEGAAEINITPDEWRVLVLVNGQRTVLDIAEAVKADVFATMRTLYGLAATGLIHVPGFVPEDDDEELPELPPEPAAFVEETSPEPEVEVARPEASIAPEAVAEEPSTTDVPSGDEPAPSLEESAYHADAYDPGVVAADETSADDAFDFTPAAETETTESGTAETVEATDMPTAEWFDAPEPGDIMVEGPGVGGEQHVGGEQLVGGEQHEEVVSSEDPFASEVLAPETPAEETEPDAGYSGTEEVVDKRAAVRELSDLFRQSEVENNPSFLIPEEPQREEEDVQDPVDMAAEPESKHRVEDDEEITRGLISRLIDGVKGL